jgi:hypothetical protein
MEELLQPWVHYIPISDDLSDVEEKVQWIVMYHPDATKDNEWIIDEALKRYRSHFTYNPSLKI